MKNRLIVSMLSIAALYFGFIKPIQAEGGVQMKVYVEGEGGTVKDDGGFICLSGSVCLREVPVNSTLNYTAEASEGSVFLGWDSDCGSETACSIEITEDTVLIAHFATVSRLERADSTTSSATLSRADEAVSSSRSPERSPSPKPDVVGTGELTAVQNTHPDPIPASSAVSVSSAGSSSGTSGK